MSTGKEILVKRLKHREKDVLMLYFAYNEELISQVKDSPFKLTFSKTHKGWWLPYSKENLDNLIQHFRNKIWLKLEWREKEGSKLPQKRKKEVTHLPDLVPQAYKDLLTRRRYSENTFRIYTTMFNQYLHFIAPLKADEATEEDIRRYQDYLVKKRKLSQSTQNQAINAIKFYYEKLMGQEKKTYYIERPRKEKKLPTVLSEGEVLKILKHTENMKHRLLFAFLYATGLRIGELLKLRIQDVDLERLTVHIRSAKGKKDRISILSGDLVPVIKTYLEKYKPNYWLFEGSGRKRYSANSVRASLHKSVEAAGIKKRVTPHILRHSFATHLHEQGTDIRNIQELLGHNSPDTTMIYTYVSKRSLQKIKSPLDAILRSKLLDG